MLSSARQLSTSYIIMIFHDGSAISCLSYMLKKHPEKVMQTMNITMKTGVGRH